MGKVIGMRNAGFDIVEATRTTGNHGYCIGKNKNEYVTWWYTETTYDEVYFHYGHYFRIDPDSPAKTRAAVRADYYRRLADTFETLVQYGEDIG